MSAAKPVSVEHWHRRHPLLVVALAPILAVLTSVVFNVWYGVAYIEPLLTPRQTELLQLAVLVFNIIVFPSAGALWAWIVWSLQSALNGKNLPAATLAKLRARAINLPWHFSAIVAAANTAGIIVFGICIRLSGEPLYQAFDLHLVIMVAIAALITITIAFFLVELLVLLLVFPRLFAGARPYETPGSLPLSLTLRALLMAVAGGIGPIIMLLLIGWADDVLRGTSNPFRVAVGVLGMAFAFFSAWLFGTLVVVPIHRLSRASRAVAGGDLGTRVHLLRADEFGSLVDEFNGMVGELREKQKLRETFGLHVGEAAAEQILSRDPGLGGQTREITVMFCDIRGFTAYSAGRAPAEVVSSLNDFLGRMVEVIERRHGGMINKFLGDGFMALFGAGGSDSEHAQHAVEAARKILAVPGQFRIGIGINTGVAIVGNIGSASRLEYTAIGDAVNLASRIEALTKELGTPVLLSRATRDRLPAGAEVTSAGSHAVRGQPAAVEVFTLADR